MSVDPRKWLADRQTLIDAGAYDPDSERDACGVGLVAAIDGQPRRDVVDLAIAALKAVWHRGAVDADGRSGDGAGLLIGLPRRGASPGPPRWRSAWSSCRATTWARRSRRGW